MYMDLKYSVNAMYFLSKKYLLKRCRQRRKELVMGLFGKLFKGPEIDQEKSQANKEKMRALFNHVVANGDQYRLLACYTEDVRRFNYGLVHGSKSTIASLIVGWKEDDPTVVLVPTVPDLSESAPHGDVVYQWYRAGITQGDQNGNFNGNSHITRSETAAILCRLAGLTKRV